MFTKWAFRNKASMILTVILVLAVGVFSFFKLPYEYLPDADQPFITVNTIAPGYDASSIVNTVTTPMEKAIANVKGKTNLFSTSADGFSQIQIMYTAGTKMKDAKEEVQEAISAVQLPQGIKPMVSQLNTSMIPISQVSIAFKDSQSLTKANMETLEKKIVPTLEGVNGVSSVMLYGKANPVVTLTLNKDKMAQMNLPAATVLGVLQGQNISAAVADKTVDGKASTIKVDGSITSIDTLMNIPVVPGVKLNEIATSAAKIDSESVTRLNGKDAAFVMIMKETGANAADVSKNVESKLNDLNKEIPGLEANVFWAAGDMVRESVNSMMKEVGMGALFATIVILFFLRSLRTTLITIVSIPLSLGLTLFLLHQSGVTLNILTLGGVAVAVGRLVDDSIVVVENIFRKAQQGQKMDKDMITGAVKEVASAITSSTLTTVAVFLPMGLVQGSLRQFLLPFAETITYSLLSSLLVALTVVPLLSLGLLKNAKLPKHKEHKRFIRTLTLALNHKFLTIFLALALFIGSIGLYIIMPKGVLDAKDSTMISGSVTFPSDMPTAEVREKGKAIEKFMIDQKEAKSVLMMTGTNSDGAKYGDMGSNTIVNYNILINKGENAQQFLDQVKAQKANYKNTEFQFGAMSMMGGSGGSNITYDLVGTNVADLITASSSVMNAMKDVDGVEKMTSNQQETKPIFVVQVDPSIANAQEVAMQLQSLMNRTPIGSIKLEGKDTTVLLEPSLNPASTADLQQIQVATKTGVVSLSQIAKIVKTNEASTVLHKDGDQYLRLTLTMNADKIGAASKELAKKEKDLKLPEGVKLHKGGATEDQNKEMADLGLTMLASIGIVYLIMVLSFKTMRAPLAILFSLPLAAIGAVLGLLISGVTVDITSAIGALMLIGIVVTNAIVLVERVKHNEETMTIRESLLEAASIRMRPIIMTAVATVCAMLPLLLKGEEMGSIVSKSLAVVVIGGLIVSTLLTLVVVPVVYEALHWKKSKRQRKALVSGKTNEAVA